jgi:hypothetical protein
MGCNFVEDIDKCTVVWKKIKTPMHDTLTLIYLINNICTDLISVKSFLHRQGLGKHSDRVCQGRPASKRRCQWRDMEMLCAGKV